MSIAVPEPGTAVWRTCDAFAAAPGEPDSTGDEPDSAGEAEVLGQLGPLGERPVRVGFIVAKRQLKRAVDRNRVQRQLRHLMAERLERLPAGALVVVRASAACLGEDAATLGRYLDRAISGALAKLARESAARATGDA